MSKVVVAIYVDADFYPPTINAVLNLSEVFSEVVLISRNNSVKDFPFPENVHLKKIGRYCSVREMEKQSLLVKVKSFLQFTLYLLRFGRKKDTNLILLYDSFALFSFSLVKVFLKEKKIWYHNHDMPNRKFIKQFSIGGLAAKYEEVAMKSISFFSLPAKERLAYYPHVKNSIPVFIIPNYPSLKVYTKRPPVKSVDKEIKIVFQGFIGEGIGLEEIVKLIAGRINGVTLSLHLKGSVQYTFKKKIDELAEQFAVSDRVHWLSIGPYNDIPTITASFDIGIGINMKTDLVSQTQGTASNKIYEYAASGLAVILYDSPQFTNYLSQYSWAYFTDGSLQSLQNLVEKIIPDLSAVSIKAREGFETELNFEKSFIPVLNKIRKSI